MTTQPGIIALFGSGETAPGAQKIYHHLFERLGTAVRVAILETPAGFEPNSSYVAGQIGRFLEKRLQNFRPQIAVVPARKRGTPFSPDEPALLEPLYDANVVIMGPGSPTYAVRQLQGSLAWEILRARQRMGATVILASAATLAVSAHTVPVYEIYKAGEELHWKPGLDLFADYGLSLVLVPHWNNRDGGEVLDTSRCYLGQARFEQLLSMLEPDAGRTVVGIDENTAVLLEPAGGVGQVMGGGMVTVMRGDQTRGFGTGPYALDVLFGAYRLPEGAAGIPAATWQRTVDGVAAADAVRAAQPQPTGDVLALVAARTAARRRQDWQASDQLRDQIAALGWRVLDTPAGPQVEALG